MDTDARSRTSWIALFAGLCLASVACEKPEGDPGTAKADAPPALAKPVEADAPALERPRSEPPAPSAKDGGDVVADEGPTEVDEVDVTGEDQGKATRTKSKRGKSKRREARNRASSGESVEEKKSGGDAHAPVLRLKRIQLTESIDKREPVDPEETFSAAETDKLYAFFEIVNESKQATKIVVTFIPPMGSHSKVTLKVGETSRWRTWALRKSPKAIGTWKVVVHDEMGRELGSRKFQVTE